MLKPKTLYFYLIAIGILLSLTFSVKGQSGNYWNYKFNTEATLTSGAVVGGGGGISAIFFNPAEISDIKNSQFSFSANVFSLKIFNYRNAFGPGEEFKDWRIDIEPRFLGFLINPKKEDKISIELSSFTRDQVKYEVNQRIDQTTDILPGSSLEDYSGDYFLKDEFYNYWVGVGLSYQWQKTFSIGLSTFVSYKNVNYHNKLKVNVIEQGNVDEPSSNSYEELIDGYSYNLIFKLGTLLKKESWSIGATITTASLGVFSNATVFKDVSTNNLYENGVRIPDQIMIQKNEDVPMTIKDPWSFSFGVNYYFPNKKTIISFSSEVFLKISPYEVISETDFKDETRDTYAPYPKEIADNFMTYQNSGRTVVNAALGIQYKIKENLKLLGGLKTDFSYKENTTEGLNNNFTNDLISVNQNLFNISTGLNFSIRKSEFVVGLDNAFAINKKNRYIINYAEPLPLNDRSIPLVGNNNQEKSKFITNNLGLFLGIIYNFNRSNED